MLDLTHDELVSYLQVHGQPWREDESNEDAGNITDLARVCEIAERHSLRLIVDAAQTAGILPYQSTNTKIIDCG